jgi:hypothetical protein
LVTRSWGAASLTTSAARQERFDDRPPHHSIIPADSGIAKVNASGLGDGARSSAYRELS